MPDGFARTQKRPAQVHGKDAIEIRHFHFMAGGGLLNAGIVHQHVERAEGLDDLLEHGLDLLFVRNVGLHHDGFASSLPIAA